MAIVQNLYQVFKLKASTLVENNCNMTYAVNQGIRDGNVVAIGDNIIFQQLRYMRNDFRDYKEVYNYTSQLRKTAHKLRKQGKYANASLLDQLIFKELFVEDIVNVEIDKKKSDFDKFRITGFTLNGKHYTYLCSGSGQIRRNTVTFIYDSYHDKMVEIINCGLDKKTSQFTLAKYTAYFALAFSSILWVRTPRVCVIHDYYHTLKDTPVDFICKDASGKSIIEKRTMDLELNGADGQGIIDPSFAELWAQDMNLDYTPCSFVARSCFVKGNLVTFDFKEYAHLHGITTIRDKWGKEYPIDEIDVLLSESQFKTSKYYDSWQEYQSYAQKGDIHWGVARYNKKQDAEYTPANYQYIQSLSLSQEDIHELIQPTVDWINKICSGDPVYALLYSFGSRDQDTSHSAILSSAQTAPMKAIVKNPEFLKDTYIQRKIYKNIAESINHAKIGKIWIHGNYEFMISDPMAQVQSALGLDPVGLLKANEIYSDFWRQRCPAGTVLDCCRSPMIDQHEHNPMNLAYDEEKAYWYKYIYSGFIYNSYDTSCYRHEDSDYDGDICLVTDNPFFIKGSHKDHNIITYEKGLATPSKMTIPNITATVKKGLGSGVGGFSNTATILYAMAPIFDKPGHEDQHQTIMTRIKLLREIVGQEIDRIKGADKPNLPPEWKKYETIDPADSEEEKNRKMRQNAMVISKKPYFFRYLYPELNQQFKQFEASYNQISRDMFGIKFKKLLKKEDKTDEERMLVRRYQKYSPLITAPCTMNILCREFESIDFDIQFAKDSNDVKKPVISMLPSFSDKFADTFSRDRLKFVRSLYARYNAKTQISILNDVISQDDPSYEEIRTSLYDALIEGIRAELHDNGIAGDEFLYYCSQMAASNKSFNWGFPWVILGDDIVKFIPQGDSMCPVLDEDGPYEYLGRTYSIKYFNTEEDLDSILDSADTDPQTIDENTFDVEALFSNNGDNDNSNDSENNNDNNDPQEV